MNFIMNCWDETLDISFGLSDFWQLHLFEQNSRICPEAWNHFVYWKRYWLEKHPSMHISMSYDPTSKLLTVFPKYISKHLVAPAEVVSWYWCSQLKAKFWSESGFRFVPWPHNGWPDKLRLGLENLDFQIGSLWGFEISQFWRSQISGFTQIWLAIGQGSFYSIDNGLSIESIASKDIL